MENDNETVEQLCDYLANNGNDTGEPIRVAMPSLANRIRDAHNREVVKKTAEITELKQAIRQTISACCGNCPSFDEGRYCTYIGPCNWKYLHTTLFGTSN